MLSQWATITAPEPTPKISHSYSEFHKYFPHEFSSFSRTYHPQAVCMLHSTFIFNRDKLKHYDFMKHQQVVIDYTNMLTSSMICVMVAFFGWVLIKCGSIEYGCMW